MRRFFLLGTVAAALAVGLSARTSHASNLAACGVERWAVKTLQDRPHLLPARKTTIVLNTLFPLNRGGLRPNIVYTGAIEYTF